MRWVEVDAENFYSAYGQAGPPVLRALDGHLDDKYAGRRRMIVGDALAAVFWEGWKAALAEVAARAAEAGVPIRPGEMRFDADAAAFLAKYGPSEPSDG